MKGYVKFLLLTCSLLLAPCSLYSQFNDWLWATHGKDGTTGTGGLGENIVATDYSANCFLTGILFGGDSIYFGPYRLWNNGNNSEDIYLVKFDNNGNVLWAKQSNQHGNDGDVSGYDVSTDGSGNAYIMANFTDTISFDSDILRTQPGNMNQGYYEDNFLVKYTPNGNVVWARQSKIPSLTSLVAGNSLATDLKGNSYITGAFYDTVYFGGKTIIGTLSADTIEYTFLTKYDANGNVKWVAQSTGRSRYGSDGICVAANNSDGVFISGVFDDSVTFGSYKLQAPLSHGDVFIVKYDTNGNVKWTRAGIFPSSHNIAIPEGITADRFGNVYVAGFFWDTLIFAKDTLFNPEQSAYNTNVFIVKYDANGNVKWAKAGIMLDNNPWLASTLSSDNRGEVFMSGAGQGLGLCEICFGNDTLSIDNTGKFDTPSFVVKYDSSGNVLCATINPCAGGANTTTWSGVASDTSGNYVYFGGIAFTEGIFGNDTINPFAYYPSGGELPFIARWRECEPTLGVENITAPTNDAEVNLYPNPNNGNFTLEYDLGTGANGYVQLYNTMGQMVGEYSLANSQGKMNISNPQLSNGVYLWKLFSNNQPLKYGKVVIMK